MNIQTSPPTQICAMRLTRRANRRWPFFARSQEATSGGRAARKVTTGRGRGARTRSKPTLRGMCITDPEELTIMSTATVRARRFAQPSG